MTRQINQEDPHIEISKTAAVYLLETARRLVSRLHGANYDPNGGRFGEDYEPGPSLFERQAPGDEDVYHWMAATSSLLKVIAGILARVLLENNENINPLISDAADSISGLFDDEGGESVSLRGGDVLGTDSPHTVTDPSTYWFTDGDGGYETDDEASEVLYGQQDEKTPDFDSWFDD